MEPEADIANDFKQALIEDVRYHAHTSGRHVSSWVWEDTVMRLSSSFVAPSAIAILSTALLCGLSGTAVSQTATGSGSQLPGITVVSPKQVARPQKPQQVARPPQRPT